MHNAETTQSEDFGLLRLLLHFSTSQFQKHALLRHTGLSEHGFKTSICQLQGQQSKASVAGEVPFCHPYPVSYTMKALQKQ